MLGKNVSFTNIYKWVLLGRPSNISIFGFKKCIYLNGFLKDRLLKKTCGLEHILCPLLAIFDLKCFYIKLWWYNMGQPVCAAEEEGWFSGFFRRFFNVLLYCVPRAPLHTGKRGQCPPLDFLYNGLNWVFLFFVLLS